MLESDGVGDSAAMLDLVSSGEIGPHIKSVDTSNKSSSILKDNSSSSCPIGMYGALNDNSSSSSSGGEPNITESDLNGPESEHKGPETRVPESVTSLPESELNDTESELKDTVSDPYCTNSGGESRDGVPSDIDSGEEAPGLHSDGTILCNRIIKLVIWQRIILLDMI